MDQTTTVTVVKTVFKIKISAARGGKKDITNTSDIDGRIYMNPMALFHLRISLIRH